MDATGLTALGILGAVAFGLAGYAGWKWWMANHPPLPMSSPMPDIGDDPTTDMRDKTAVFYTSYPVKGGDPARIVIDEVFWWKAQSVLRGIDFTVADQTPQGPITAIDRGDCKQWAALAYVTLCRELPLSRALRFIWCEFQGGGHLMLGLDTDKGVYVSEVNAQEFVPWTDKMGSHTTFRIERADKAAPWQVVN